MGATRIGCASWSIPRQEADAFPAAGSHLERYARVFNCVEINSSFYRPHQRKTYERWAATVADDFLFSVKLPRTITHEARLAGCDELLARFADEVDGLGTKLGCLLVQMAPSHAFDHAIASAFFHALRARFSCLLACEGRHPSWFEASAGDLLREQNIIRVIADPPAGSTGPYKPTTEASYIRLHGSPRIYYSAYSEERLSKIAAFIREHGQSWCIFDNTAAGAAVPNALALQHAFANRR
ncbi:DUF72 domain-containing protein [Pseudoduganella violacea]|uniref:Uncharacterized protein YecE (DUF72 family) n=1 Tax=Pseudoduganella violacea TaxID=1715466 RepID=A0A7W5B855_9BURK|nr:DUF72 domain-containing protein [Pseudoduganella violacea]MBB3118288.1 uncharacterized protein YecE (DUF72 family) [Pseudoduganella violacea]